MKKDLVALHKTVHKIRCLAGTMNFISTSLIHIETSKT